MLEETTQIPVEDAVSIAKLLGEVAGLEADLPTRKRVLMRELQLLVDADGWLWSVSHSIHEKNQPISIGVVHEGLTEEQFDG